MKVDDIDPQGKVSLSLAGDAAGPDRQRVDAARRAAGRRRLGLASVGPTAFDAARRRAGRVGPSTATSAPVASFEAAFEAELVSELGDLGPGPALPAAVTEASAAATAAETAAATAVPGVLVGGERRARRSPESAELVSASAAGDTAASPSPTSGDAPVIRTEVLDCGARLVTEPMAEARSVTVGVWVGTGSRDEDDAHSGASHFLEHLLFKGTPTWSAADIAESVDEIGGDMNAFTTKEYTAFYIRLLADDLPLGLDVLGAIMTDPALRRRRHRCRAPGDPGRDPHARRRARRLRRRAVHGGDVPRPSPRSRGPGHPAERGGPRPARDPPLLRHTTTGPGTSSSRRPATSTTTGSPSRSNARFAGRTGGRRLRAGRPRRTPGRP